MRSLGHPVGGQRGSGERGEQEEQGWPLHGRQTLEKGFFFLYNTYNIHTETHISVWHQNQCTMVESCAFVPCKKLPQSWDMLRADHDNDTLWSSCGCATAPSELIAQRAQRFCHALVRNGHELPVSSGQRLPHGGVHRLDARCIAAALVQS